MTGRDVVGQLLLIAFAAVFLGMAIFEKTINRRSTGRPDPHPGRMRVAFAAIGLASLTLCFAEYVALGR